MRHDSGHSRILAIKAEEYLRSRVLAQCEMGTSSRKKNAVVRRGLSRAEKMVVHCWKKIARQIQLHDCGMHFPRLAEWTTV